MGIEAGLFISIISVVIAVLGFQLSKTQHQVKQQQREKDEVKNETKQDTKVETQLEYIGRGVDDIRIDLKANEKQMVALGERVARVEESSRSAHKRLDRIKEDGKEVKI